MYSDLIDEVGEKRSVWRIYVCVCESVEIVFMPHLTCAFGSGGRGVA